MAKDALEAVFKLNERVYIHQGSPQIDWFSWDEIFHTVTEDDDPREIYIKVPFFLNSNVARIILSSFHLKMTFSMFISDF